VAGYRNHWLIHGIKEMRQASAIFRVSEYIMMYPDLKEAFGDDAVAATVHYVVCFLTSFTLPCL
jgi:hypothetical protein